MWVWHNPIKTIVVVVCFGITLNSWAQNPAVTTQLEIKQSTEPIKVDGILEEAVWQERTTANGFHQFFPTDSIAALSDTEVMLAFDEDFLYVAAICHDTLSGDYVISSLRRDFNWGVNDNFSIYIDPFNDLTNGFTFGVSPLGVQREGLISNGEEISSDWDNKWFSAVETGPTGWTVEMAIPFKSIRYNPNNREWNINFLRNNQKQNERSSWIMVPQQFRASNLAFSGKLFWNRLPQNTGANIVLIPYVSTAISKDHEAGTSTDYALDGGLDAKIAVSPSLNLDVTVNPDFSQVEVDQQVTSNCFLIPTPDNPKHRYTC